MIRARRHLLHLFALVASSVSILSGCGIVTIQHPSSGREGRARNVPEGQAEHHASIEARFFPETVAFLKQADDAITAKQFDAALTAAQSASASLTKESTPASYDDVAPREAHQRLELQRWVLEGSALRGLGKEMEALLAVGKLTFDAGGCRLDLRPQCKEYAHWLAETFPGIVRDESFVSLSPATSTPFTHDLSDLEMNVSEREMQMRKGYVAVRIQPTAKKPDKDGVALRVDGSTSTGSYEDCNKVGEVRIGETDFDVKRCGQKGYTAHRVDFFATVPSDNASLVTGAPGEEVFIVFNVKTWKKNGKVYSSGPARVAYVTPPRQK